MSFDLASLRDAVATYGRVARVVVAEAAGSAPREVGATMLVWNGGQSGTIGGGALEFESADRAREMIRDTDWQTGRAPHVEAPDQVQDGVSATSEPDATAAPQAGPGPTEGGEFSIRRQRAGAPFARLDRYPLGPALGQCCGGAVSLVTEVYDTEALGALPVRHGHLLRPVSQTAPAEPPLNVLRLLAQSRRGAGPLAPRLANEWFIEPCEPVQQSLWLWGAGHVGRAIARVMTPLPDWQITWIDSRAEAFPEPLPEGISPFLAARPKEVVARAPQHAHHLILTYSHSLDLELCHRLLTHGFASAGLIGSATKWARFRKRLRELGHTAASIDRITCPIGDPSLGKHPQAIALGVAAQLLAHPQITQLEQRA